MFGTRLRYVTIGRSENVLVTVLLAASLKQSLTISLGPDRPKKILASLSQQVGEKLVCAPGLEKEILMIRVKNVSWPVLKTKLAEVSWAQWRKREDEWVFERPQSLVRLHKEAVLRKRAAEFKSQIKAVNSRLTAWTPATLNQLLAKQSQAAETEFNAGVETKSAAIQAMLRTGIDTPAGRALTRVLALIDPAELASLSRNSMAVYSTRPTAVERKLPDGTGDVLKQFVVEHESYAAGIAGRKDLFAPVAYLDPRFNVAPDLPQATRFVIVIRRMFDGGPDANLSAVDADGRVVARAGFAFSEPSQNATPFKDLPAYPVTLSQTAKEFEAIYTVVSGRYGGDLGDRAAARKLAIEWIPTFIKSGEIEPMGFIVGDILSQTAKESSVNLVADLPDKLLTFMPMSRYEKDLQSRSLVERMASPFNNMTGKFADGWLELTPADPVSATEDRIDREALGAFSRQVAEKKRVTLDDLANYAVKVPGHICFESIDAMIAKIYANHDSMTGSGLANYYCANVLRFWGSLSAGQRTAIRKGEGFAAATLSAEAKFWLNEMVYNVPRAFATNWQTPLTVPPLSLERRNILESPYEGLPNGISGGSKIYGVAENATFLNLQMGSEDESGSSEPSTFGSWFGGAGWKLSGPDSPLRSIAYRMHPMFTLNIDFGNGYRHWTRLGDDIESWPEPGPYESLPEDVRKVIESSYDLAARRKAEAERKAKDRTIPPGPLSR